MCCPYEEGGLGIRRIKDVSTVFVLKLIWRLFSQASSLWVTWVHHYLLRQEVFWDARDTVIGSWVWRKLLRFRPLAKGFIRMKIQYGCSVRFWTDLWHPKGRLIDLAGEIGTQKLGIGRSARICDVFVDGEWRFRICRDHFLQDLVHDIRELPLILTANVPDRVLWRDGDDTYSSRFNSKNTWSNIRKKKDQVMWSRLIWFQQGVPRFAFITWLAVRDRLSTGHRTAQWGQAQYCLYCGEPDETRDHLFFACPYTFTLWLKVAGNLFGMDPDPDWDTTITRLLTGHYDRLTFILLRLELQVTIYYFWRERNERLHNHVSKPVEHIARLVDKTVRNRIMSTCYYLRPRLQGLMQRWFGAHDT